jgi:hypothetical protein
VCIHIAVVDHLQDIAVWDPDELLIFVQRGTRPADLIRELHALLHDLGAPPSTGGLTCFCHMPIQLPTELHPGGITLGRRRLHHLDIDVESLIPRQVPRGA